jgi:hypothetical protein
MYAKFPQFIGAYIFFNIAFRIQKSHKEMISKNEMYSCGILSYSEPCRFIKIDDSSLLDIGYFYKSIWREAIHEQKESLEGAILRMRLRIKQEIS